MIIETRFRDITYEEYCKCFHDPRGLRENWNAAMGKPVQIETPGHARTIGSRFRCDGPFFYLAGRPETAYGIKAVCPHIAEIGD